MTAPAQPAIFISAGEASGDLHGAGVVSALLKTSPTLRVFGLGGDKMQEQGVELLMHSNRMSFMGFAEVVRHLPFIAKVKQLVISQILERRPALLILIDYPGFHFSLLRTLRKMRTNYRPKVLYYIAPQVWAWKAGRAKELAQLADGIGVIFLFEVPIFQEHGVETRFVGHPLLDEAGEIPPRGEFLNGINFAADDRVVGLFPGSRKQEIRRHLPLLIETVKPLRKFVPDVKFILAESPHVPTALYEQIIGTTVGIARVRGQSHAILSHANASLVKSGSTTIEAAYFGNPFVVYYKTSPLSYQIGKRVVKVPYIAMANLLAQEKVVPELVQHDATPDNLAGELIPLLTIPHRIKQARDGLDKVRAQLGEPGAGKRIAAWAAEMIERN